MKFEPIVPNPDIDVHPDPPGHWAHVAVICRWKDAHAQRKQWPHASIVGPLRTTRGLDELARNLLHNPQIRVVLVVGNDQTEGEETTEALLALWAGKPEGEKHIGEEVRGPFWDVQTLVQLVCPTPPKLQPSVPLQELTALAVKRAQRRADEGAGRPVTLEGEELTADLLAQWRRLAQFPDLLPPWTHETKPPDYEPACGHFHGRFGCTNDWCGHGAEGFRPAPHPSPLQALMPSDYQSERPKVTLPPPPPTANATAPSGDPGERVVGETLADLWPQILHRAMRFGVQRSTHHGPTRELLCLVGVVRDVEKSARDFYTRWSCEAHGWSEVVPLGEMHGSCPQCGGYLCDDEPHPVLQISYTQAEGYRKRISQAEVPEGTPYSYGSRMRGVSAPTPELDAAHHRGECPRMGSTCTAGLTPLRTTAGLETNAPHWWCPYCGWTDVPAASGPDQIEAVEKLLTEKPDTRAAYLTPWRPGEDAGKESGRPCMVGAWFRVEQPEQAPPASDKIVGYLTPEGRARRTAAGLPPEEPPQPPKYVVVGEVPLYAAADGGVVLPPSEHRLHLVVAFRSHDLFAAYPTNLAGLLLWQVETARKLGMRPGTLTVTSYSAHVYERDWTAAEVVIKQHYEEARREPSWDQRSSWHVELIQPVVEEKPVEVGEVLQVPRSASGVLDAWKVQATWSQDLAHLYDHIWIENQTTGERQKVSLHHWREKRGDYRGPQPKPTLRATALTPDGREVLGVFSAETAEALRAQIERSGLVTSVGAALWLGDEIRKVSGRM